MGITKEAYLIKKSLQQNEDLKTFSKENFCYRCYRLTRMCLCSSIEPFESSINFVILMHPMEAKKEKLGTGRLSKAILKNAQIIVGVDFTDDLAVNQLIAMGNCFILYPGEDAINISNHQNLPSFIPHLEVRPTVFVIDGTWPCAKKMMRESKNLHDLPKISFDFTEESEFQIKEQPSKFCLSTIESIHRVLKLVEPYTRPENVQFLDQFKSLFATMVQVQIDCASNPSLSSYRNQKKGYSKPSERKRSTKWDKRSILFIKK